MELVRFTNQLGGKDPTQPPFRIPAKDLDSNFAKLRPLPTDGNSRQYAVESTPEGWFLRLFPDSESSALGSGLPSAPSGGTGPSFLGYNNGTLYWSGSGGSTGDPQQDLNPVIATAAPSVGTYVLGSVNGVVQWLETEACT
jgi:hypothetical protein